MSWSDLFYPGNKQKRDQIIRHVQQIKSAMQLNFEGANELITMVNEHLKPKPFLKPILLDDSATVEANAKVFIASMEEVQKVIEKFNAALSKDLDPEIYKKIHDPDLDFEKIFGYIKPIVDTIIGVTTLTSIYVVVQSIRFLGTIINMVGKFNTLLVSGIATVGLGVLGLGVDMIASAIIGAVERKKLQDALNTIEPVANEFVPASRQYYRAIIRVSIKIEDIPDTPSLKFFNN